MAASWLIVILPYSQFSQEASIPSTYTWDNLSTDTVMISYSYTKFLGSCGTGYIHIKANSPGTYCDTKTARLRVTVPDDLEAVVYVCGDDRNRIPNGWTVEEKSLELYVDGKKVYSLGREYWWARCYSKAYTLNPGIHDLELRIHICVKVSSSFGERDLVYAVMEVKIMEGGTVGADFHRADATLDGAVMHTFTFTLPQASGVEKIDWKAVWSSMEKTGSGPPGSVQTVVFNGVNRDSWIFTSPVVLTVGGPPPSVKTIDGYFITALYNEGSGSVGIFKTAVALSNGDEVGFTSGSYLVTSIEYVGLDAEGYTATEGREIWANSGSEVSWAHKVRVYGENGWVVEETASGVETGFCTVREVAGSLFSKNISFSSKNRVDEITLTVNIPQLKIHFDSMKAEPVGPIDLGRRIVGEKVDLKVNTVDCLNEYSRIDVYTVSEETPGVRNYSYGPIVSVYKGISSVTGGNVTFTVKWSSCSIMVKNALNAKYRDGEYWAQSGSTVMIEVYVSYSDDASPMKDARVMDSEGNTVLTGQDGVAVFQYSKTDCRQHLTYVMVDESGNKIGNEVGLTIIYTSIRLSLISIDCTLFNDAYYSCNGAHAKIVVKATYTHSSEPVSGALVVFKPSGHSSSTDSEGLSSLTVSGVNSMYDGNLEVNDGFITGNMGLKLVFTNVILESDRRIIEGSPGEKVNVTIRALFTFNNAYSSGIPVKWIEGNLVGETPVSFTLTIPWSEPTEVSFEAIGFFAQPLRILLYPKTPTIKPNDNRPQTPVNSTGETRFGAPDNIVFITEDTYHSFILNIGDLLKFTIPKVTWLVNGSIALGVRIGVMSQNGTVVSSSVVSKNGVEFSWTELKPGVYRYFVKPLVENMRCDPLIIEAVFTAFNITPRYILDLEDTHVVYATVLWAHNNSPAGEVSVHAKISGSRTVSDRNGVIELTLKESSYNSSCIEEITVLEDDPHPSGVWKTLEVCRVKIVRLSLRWLTLTGDQHGFEASLSLESVENSVQIPFKIRIEGYSPELSCLIRVLQVRSDNSSMMVFIKPLDENIREVFSLKIGRVDYDGRKVKVTVYSLSNNLTIRNVTVSISGSTVREVIGDLPPGSSAEAVLELPEDLAGLDHITVLASANNTLPHAVRIRVKSGVSPLILVSIIPLLAAVALWLKDKRRGSEQRDGGKHIDRELSDTDSSLTK
ncbi:MAG: hypothetical protein ACUVQ0_04245 [Thermoproteota archaeon]